MRAVRSAALACAVMVAGSTSAGAAEKIVYASYMSEVYTISKVDLWVMAEIEKRSNGEIEFEKYFSGSLLKAPDLFPGLQDGAADMVTGTPAAYNRNDYRLSNVVLPFISSKADAVGKALVDLYASNASFRGEFEGRNIKLLYAVPWAENTFWSAKPLAKVEDFAGLKVRSVQAIADSVQMMGGTPVAMAWPEALEALGRGVVDVVSSTPFDSGVLGGVYESAKVGSDGGDMGIFSFAATAFNQRRWDGLSDEHKKIFLDVTAEAPTRFLSGLNFELQKAAEKLCAYKGDLTVTLFPESERKKAYEVAAMPLQAQWVKWAAETTKADTAAMLQQYLDLVRKYEASSTWKSGFERYEELDCGK
ncbi:MAG: TRAP transporter substrate-binding protein DctP [Thalassobaculaceae bacterium]|nr:TRAP transporter substrate-binding protein DctP [Thalassobaculaceae bacterium]